MPCFRVLLHHNRVYTCVFVILILLIRVPINAVSENICPNNITDIFGAKCYSLNTEWPKFWYKYNDAVEYCKRNGGTLLSTTTEEEVDFLRELYTKINRWSYWVSGYRYNEDWKYSSDNTSIPMRLIKNDSEPANCIAIKLSKNELVPITCDHNTYYICAYSSEKCEPDLCYQISYTKENFTGAIKKCKQVGYKGHLVEIRNEEQTFAFLTTKEQDELIFPSIWKRRNPSLINNQCEIYTVKSSQVHKYDCNEPFGFVCEYKATVTSNTRKSSQIANLIPLLDTSPTLTSYKFASSVIPLLQSTKSGINMINGPPMPISNTASSTSSQANSTVAIYNASAWNNRQTTKLICISIAVAVLILIGIIILIILLVRIMRKNTQRKNEIIYLEPIVHSTNNTINRRSGIRDLPDIPCDSTDNVRNSIFPECESLQKPDPEEPLQNTYTYID